MSDDADNEIICATYTHARRHPLVVGNIGGWTLPIQLTIVQVAVLFVVCVIEVKTWSLWAAHLPVSVALVVGVGAPCLLAWVVRRTRIEGRSLPRLALGWMQWMAMPRAGQVGGRPYRPERASAPLGGHIYVASEEAVR